MQATVDAAVADARAARAEANGLRAELDVARGARDALREEIRAERQKAASAESRATCLEDQRDALNRLTREAETALGRITREEKEAAAEVTKLRAEAGELARKLKTAKGEVSAREERQKIANLLAEMAATEREVTRNSKRTTSTMASLEASVRKLTTRLNDVGGGGDDASGDENAGGRFLSDRGDGSPAASPRRAVAARSLESEYDTILGLEPLRLKHGSKTSWFPTTAAAASRATTNPNPNPNPNPARPSEDICPPRSAAATRAEEAMAEAEAAVVRRDEREREQREKRERFFRQSETT
jgi:hypothetical protein